VAQEEHITALVEDLTGQVTEALSKSEFFQKWGKHYLPSLTRAHLSQYCNNFKDPGVQHYGGDLFKKIQEEADDTFMKLPPPTPSKKAIPSNSYHSSPSSHSYSAPAPSVNMASYNCFSNPCFDGDCLVAMVDGSIKRVKDVKMGDEVLSPEGTAKVLCVVKTICVGGQTQLVQLPGGLKVTPWHPVRDEGTWKFPGEMKDAEYLSCPAVFSFALDRNHVMVINDIECVTLGHGFEGRVVGHPFFGTQAVIKNLKKMTGWATGMIVLRAGCLMRDLKTGFVSGFSLDSEMLSFDSPPCFRGKIDSGKSTEITL